MLGTIVLTVALSCLTTGASAEDHLQISLRADRTELIEGDVVVFTTTLRADEKMRVVVGTNDRGPMFQRGSVFKVRPRWPNEMQRRGNPEFFLGFCGTGVRFVVRELDAGESLTYSTSAVVREYLGRLYLLWEYSEDSPLCGFRVEPPCKLVLRVQHRVSAEWYERTVWSEELDARASEEVPNWVGLTSSNELTLQFERGIEE